MRNTYVLQKRVFDEISQKIGKENLAKKLSEHLHLGTSTVYKKIRLERVISIDDLLTLAKTYDLSVDKLIQDI